MVFSLCNKAQETACEDYLTINTNNACFTWNLRAHTGVDEEYISRLSKFTFKTAVEITNEPLRPYAPPRESEVKLRSSCHITRPNQNLLATLHVVPEMADQSLVDHGTNTIFVADVMEQDETTKNICLAVQAMIDRSGGRDRIGIINGLPLCPMTRSNKKVAQTAIGKLFQKKILEIYGNHDIVASAILAARKLKEPIHLVLFLNLANYTNLYTYDFANIIDCLYQVAKGLVTISIFAFDIRNLYNADQRRSLKEVVDFTNGIFQFINTSENRPFAKDIIDKMSAFVSHKSIFSLDFTPEIAVTGATLRKVTYVGPRPIKNKKVESFQIELTPNGNERIHLQVRMRGTDLLHHSPVISEFSTEIPCSHTYPSYEPTSNAVTEYEAYLHFIRNVILPVLSVINPSNFQMFYDKVSPLINQHMTKVSLANLTVGSSLTRIQTIFLGVHYQYSILQNKPTFAENFNVVLDVLRTSVLSAIDVGFDAGNVASFVVRLATSNPLIKQSSRFALFASSCGREWRSSIEMYERLKDKDLPVPALALRAIQILDTNDCGLVAAVICPQFFPKNVANIIGSYCGESERVKFTITENARISWDKSVARLSLLQYFKYYGSSKLDIITPESIKNQDYFAMIQDSFV